MRLRQDADQIIQEAIAANLPNAAVKRALQTKCHKGEAMYLIAVGKAAFEMAKAASQLLGSQIQEGICISKYGHIKGQLPHIRCFEAGHPIPDEHSFEATEAAITLVQSLKAEDRVLFLLSGGGSALFEKPLISGEELKDITDQLLACGAEIREINTIRKRLSAVKGGRFAALCYPAQVTSIILSDIIGDPLDMIASGPTYPDSTTYEMAQHIVEKYQLKLSEKAQAALHMATPQTLENIETVVTGSVKGLCQQAAVTCEALGYKPMILTDALSCEAREAGRFLAAIAKTYQQVEESIAFIVGGETVVHLTGKGMGGRNQEIALAAAPGLEGLKHTAIFSIGSDGTDGPTDAAGGYVDEHTSQKLKAQSISIDKVLQQNDAYHALEKTGGLIFTGPTGTNVNDVSVLLIKR